MKVLAVGDIHTKLWIIDEVRNILDDYNAVVFVGDYADDWGKEPIDTINTWKRLKELQEAYPSKIKLVIGNHDYIYVNKTSSIASGYNTGTQFMLNLPDNLDIKRWLEKLPISIELDEVTYSHAGFVGDWDSRSGLWNDESPIWVRPDNDREYNPTPQVFGHTPSETCWEVQPDVWCIDTLSTYRDGTPVGDETVLEITDGKLFNKKKLEKTNGKR